MSRPIKILLTNDDGIDAPGIVALMRAFAEYEEVETWTVAPNSGRSTTSHGMSLSQPVFAYERGRRNVAVDGLPADCVYLGLYGLLDSRPDVVVAGINKGANLGCDVIYSGTVACAREAAIRGVHGIAASLVQGDDYERVAPNVCEMAIELAKRPPSPPLIVNVNYPGGNFKGPRLARLGVRNYPHKVEKRTVPMDNRSYYWLGGPPVEDEKLPGTDGCLVSQGVASVTLLLLDQTDEEKMALAATLLPFVEPAEEK